MSDTDTLLDAGDDHMVPISLIRKANQEAAGWRVRTREAEAQLVNFNDTKAKLEAATSTIRDLKVGAALTETATRLGADPKLTKALLHTDGLLVGLDPDKADFQPALDAMVAQVIKATPAVKTAAPSNVAVRSGGDITNPGTNAPLGTATSRADLQQMSPEEIAARYHSGDLNTILGRSR